MSIAARSIRAEVAVQEQAPAKEEATVARTVATPQNQPDPVASSVRDQTIQPRSSHTFHFEQYPNVQDDITAALATDLSHSDAVPLEVVPKVSLEEEVAAALQHAASSIPSLSPASCSLQAFQSGSSNMMEQLLLAMNGMQEKLTAIQEQRLESERIVHTHSKKLIGLKEQLSDVAQQRAQLRKDLRQVNCQLESQIENRLAKEAASRQAVVERKAVQVLILKRDRELAERDRQMQDLRRQLGMSQQAKGKSTPPKPTADEHDEAGSLSPRGSSTWGASDDEEAEERPRPQKQASPMRQPSSIFEDNHAKLKSKGAYGGPWLFGKTGETPVPEKLELGSPRAPQHSIESEEAEP